jgi:hypothetical protein
MALEGLPDERAAALVMMKREIRRAVSITSWDDRWALHPWPIAGEPAKYVCWLAERSIVSVRSQALASTVALAATVRSRTTC